MTRSARAGDKSAAAPERHSAGAFDVRNVIGGLLGFYGIVLVIVGITNRSDEQLLKADGVNANLWAGIALVVVGLGFFLWSRLRPIVVEGHAGTDGPAHH
jgi:membrane-bound ClpP family serine protease